MNRSSENHKLGKVLIIVVCTVYILFLLCVGVNFALAQEPSEIPPPQAPQEVMEPAIVEHIANFIYTVYNGLTKALSFLLQQTVFKEYPKLAEFYGQIASFLVSITAVYLILLLVTAAKKVIGLLLILGWVLFIVTIVTRIL